MNSQSFLEEEKNEDRRQPPAVEMRMYAALLSLAATASAEVEVDTIIGRVKLTVPAGIQSGEVLRLRGRGLPELHGEGTGDQFVRVIVWTPERLSDEHEEALRALQEVEESAPDRLDGGSQRSIWARVK